jgi:virulence-associated protein VagC
MTTAKLFKNGRSQAVRLPASSGSRATASGCAAPAAGVLVEPMFAKVSEWFAELDRLAAEPFMPEGRQQPSTPRRDVFDDDLPA